MASKNRFFVTIFCVVFISLEQVLCTNVPEYKFANDGQFKYQAVLFSIFNQPSPTCGGSIITEWYILSSAYCTHQYVDKRDKLVAYVGTIDAKDVKQKKLIAEIKPHEEFKIDSKNFDIALIRTETKIDLSNTVQPIKLPDNADIFSGILQHSGFELGMTLVR